MILSKLSSSPWNSLNFPVAIAIFFNLTKNIGARNEKVSELTGSRLKTLSHLYMVMKALSAITLNRK